MWYICQLVSSLLILPKDVIELTFEFLTRMILEKCIFFYWLISEPPSSVVILDGFLQQLSVVAGPLEEGNDLILTCKAYGGMKHKRNSLMALVFFLFIYFIFDLIWFDRLSATVGDVVARWPVVGQHDRRSIPRVGQQFVSRSQSWEVSQNKKHKTLRHNLGVFPSKPKNK